MEIAAKAGGEPAAFRSAWLWVPVLAVGLAAVLAGHLPPGGAAEAAREAGLRLLGGDFGLGGVELGALAFAAVWIVAKPLCVIGAILWLEFRFSPHAEGKNYLLAWGVQTLTLSLFLGAMAMVSLLSLFPEPLI